jgi:hypothetical protein
MFNVVISCLQTAPFARVIPQGLRENVFTMTMLRRSVICETFPVYLARKGYSWLSFLMHRAIADSFTGIC